MSIIAMQRQYSELFRIRLGEAAGGQPTSLVKAMRITSANREVVEAFAQVYGGRPRKWAEKDQHQVKIPIDRLPIMLLPGQNVSQYMEHWKGSTCDRRCNGQVMERYNGKPSDDVCACGPDRTIDNRLCKPVSRLTVTCPEVPVVGIGLLTTRSAVAAPEFAGQLALAQPLLDQGLAVSAILRVDRLVGPERVYNVPRLELTGRAVSLGELAESNHHPELAPAAPAAIESGD